MLDHTIRREISHVDISLFRSPENRYSTMSISKKVSSDMVAAMKSRDTGRVEALRMIRAALLELEKSGKEVTDELEVRTLQKQAKMRRESIAQYSEAGRSDLVDKEERELAVLEEYLPKMLSEEEIRNIAGSVISETGATGMQDFKVVMPRVMGQTAGRAEGSEVQRVVREMLSESERGQG